MVETSRDWSKKFPFALWAYRTSFCTSTGTTPYFLVYGMEAVLPIKIEIGSLRVTLEQQILEADWAQARLDQLNLLDERRLEQQTMSVLTRGRWYALLRSGLNPNHHE